MLSALTEYDNLRAFTRSVFLPTRYMEKCIGCGVCASGCPHNAICMERCADVPEPPANTMEMGMRLLQKKGKLEDFIKLNTL